MNILFKVPGYILVFLGAITLSFGGLIVKSFEGATLWQILFWRSVFFCLVITIFLSITYKKQFFKSLVNSDSNVFLTSERSFFSITQSDFLHSFAKSSIILITGTNPS